MEIDDDEEYENGVERQIILFKGPEEDVSIRNMAIWNRVISDSEIEHVYKEEGLNSIFSSE